MAEDNKVNNFDYDILSQVLDSNTQSLEKSLSLEDQQLKFLANMDASLRKLAGTASQSAARSEVFGRNGSFGQRYDSWSSSSIRSRSGSGSWFKNPEKILDDFTDGFEENILEGFLGNDFRKRMSEVSETFFENFGFEISDIPKELGKELGKRAMSKLKDAPGVKNLVKSVSGIFNDAMNILSGSATRAAGSSVRNAGNTTLKGVDLSGGSMSSAQGLVPMMSDLAVTLAPLLPVIAGIAALLYIFEPLIDTLARNIKTYLKVAKRGQETLEKAFEQGLDRLQKDIESYVRAPFEILQQAAEDFESVWDENLRTITATQGYTKSDLQDLIAAFADRLRHEGLTDVVSSTDITSNLSRVLEAGLSGKIAEEFAYQATKLGAAIPTQDFFGYAATYSSIAANAIKAGRSQNQAIQEATDSLYDFANNILYASRELSGGFTTGLKDAQSLYEQAVRITQAAGTGNVGQISGVLAAVAGIVGATAPDLATSITDAVYKAATGGNSSDIVALRSLAGINASNTEFLKALAKDPQGVFSAMFKKLAAIYTSSGDAFMEKAETYASLFGLSAEAFQRVDFNYLAQAISAMNVTSTSLEDNIDMLRSGQTTQTQEQLKIAQINKYAIEEGLSYVLENDVARSIQEHLWQEQIALDLQETTYGVELVGNTQQNILDLLGFVRRLTNIFSGGRLIGAVEGFGTLGATRGQTQAIKNDIANLLQRTVVGSGNSQQYAYLTSGGAGLRLGMVPNISEMLGLTSEFYRLQSQLEGSTSYNISQFGLSGLMMPYARANMMNRVFGGTYASAYPGLSPNSQYNWGILGKSVGTSASGALQGLKGSLTNSYLNSITQSNSQSAQSRVASRIESMLSSEYMKEFIEGGKSYSEWTKSGTGIVNFSEALKSAGYDEREVQKYYEDMQNAYVAGEYERRQKAQEDYNTKATEFIDTRFWEEFNDPLVSMLNENFTLVLTSFDTLTTLQQDFSKYFQDKFATLWEEHWRDYSNYYIKHQIYNGGTLGLKTLEAVQKSEKESKGDLANALSEYLTNNNWNLDDLKDPQVQANMLLSQILVVLNAIMNQNNQSAGSLSLLDSLSGLALGGTYTSNLGSGKVL